MAISADLHHTLFADVPFQVRRSRILDEALGDWNNTDAVSITIPDHTRPLDPSVALQALRTRLRNIQHVVVGLGLHRPMTDRELREAVGVIPESLVQHNPDDCVEIDRVEGTSIGISRYLATSEWSLTVGTIEVHQYAGVSGGYKGIVVGCGSRGSIGRLHGRSFVCDPDVQVGRVSPNPFRAEIERIGHLTNCRLALAFVPSLNEWWFGHPSALMLLAEVAIQPWTPEHRAYQNVVLHVPASKGGSFYQASRPYHLALLHHHHWSMVVTSLYPQRCVRGLGAKRGSDDPSSRIDPHGQTP